MINDNTWVEYDVAAAKTSPKRSQAIIPNTTTVSVLTEAWKLTLIILFVGLLHTGPNTSNAVKQEAPPLLSSEMKQLVGMLFHTKTIGR